MKGQLVVADVAHNLLVFARALLARRGGTERASLTDEVGDEDAVANETNET